MCNRNVWEMKGWGGKLWKNRGWRGAQHATRRQDGNALAGIIEADG